MTCLHPECEDNARCRGLCRKHYAAVNRLVKAGKVTWEQLEADGKTAVPQFKSHRALEVAEWVLGGGDGGGG